MIKAAISFKESVKEIYPASKFGILTVSGLGASADFSRMEELKKSELEKIKASHSGYERKSFAATTPMCHYINYYRKFKKTYHVLLQLESVLLKGRGIPNAGIPVEAMFLAELKNLLLTAGHDMDKINGSLKVCTANGTESFTDIAGNEQRPAKDDLFLSDEGGILSNILCGPDQRTRITAATKNALFFVYGVEGVTEAEIIKHLEDIRFYLSAVMGDLQFDLNCFT